MDISSLQAKSLQISPHGNRVTRILAAALDSVEPSAAVRRHMRRDGSWLIVGNPERSYYLPDFRRVLVIGFGKASLPMMHASNNIFGDFITKSIIILKDHAKHTASFTSLVASHPVPDESNLRAGQRILDLLHATAADDLILFLISGGGSALLSAPSASIQLDDLQMLTRSLLSCGASIQEINTIRKHLSRVKGGQLARLAYPAHVIALIISDVIGDSLDVIASGPTVPDPTTYNDALSVLRTYNLVAQTPSAIIQHLQSGVRGQIAETPIKDDPIFNRVQNFIIGNNLQAAQAAVDKAKSEGFNTLLQTISLDGESQLVGKMLATRLRNTVVTGNPVRRPGFIIAGGETTVTLSQPCGLGGRNQELALSAVRGLAGLQEVALISLATDGNDGPTDAAGAVVTGETLERAKQSGFSPEDFLARHDAYNFFDPLGDLLKPGLTHTNVNDLTLLFAF
jgi:hydroxypyruvate reductase